MALIPGSLPSDTCYGTPQELLELFAQYLDIPAFAVSSKVLYSGTSPYPNTDFVWIDTSGTDTPILKLYNEVTGTYENYPFSGQTSPTGSEKLISTKADSSLPLNSSDYVLVSQTGILKKVTASNILPTSSVTYPMLSTSATEANNVAKRTAKAWVNFNGTGTVAIRDDFNVSSIIDNNTGDYTVNFSASLADANYCFSFGCQVDSANAAFNYFLGASATSGNIDTKSTSQLRLRSLAYAGGPVDAPQLNAVIFL